MLTRRGFAACALCAVTGFAATGADAQSAGGFKRTIITRTDGPMDGYETIAASISTLGRRSLVTPIRALNRAMSSKAGWN